MTLPVFVVDAEALKDDVIELAGAEGRHAVVVRRIQPGEHIMLTDTVGHGVECVVRSVAKSWLQAQALVRHFEPVAQPRLVVVQALPKGDHAERAVDLLTEVGVDQIVPWNSDRTVVGWRGEREAKSLARWRATAVAAAKQSRRLRFPEVSPLHTTAQVVELASKAALTLVLHEGAQTPISSCEVPVNGDVVLVVGPEGGVTDRELGDLVAVGGLPVRLGPTVLRSSTAGVVGAAAVLSRTDRWNAAAEHP
ncbi:MAG TPA: 16S rRNA (uracil(1498)-N(3))-methyltransferase [Nocardioidaceae bacterium]|nr:16S rRNA (uracil(1498)-N(3))-methyltransferase [Nocardioidaceae bacterium]